MGLKVRTTHTRTWTRNGLHRPDYTFRAIIEAWKWLWTQEIAFLRVQFFKLCRGNMALVPAYNCKIHLHQHFSPTEPHWSPAITLWQNSFSLKEYATVIVSIVTCARYVQYSQKCPKNVSNICNCSGYRLRYTMYVLPQLTNANNDREWKCQFQPKNCKYHDVFVWSAENICCNSDVQISACFGEWLRVKKKYAHSIRLATTEWGDKLLKLSG